MASTASVFFAGVATSVLLIGAGFGGGVTLVKTSMDVPQKAAQTKVAGPEKLPPPEKVVLPAMTEAAFPPPAPATVSHIQAAVPTAPQPQATPQLEPQAISAQDVHLPKQNIENEKRAQRQAESERQQAERAEQRKKAVERERRHRRYAARKARQEAVRQQQQELQQDAQREEPGERGQLGILALYGGDEPPRDSFFGD